VKIESFSERCVTALMDLIKNKVNYVVQEVIIVMKDVFRKFPNRYEFVIPPLCENLENLDEPECKMAIIWIIGENSHRIDNANELIEYFLENFNEEPVQVFKVN
jgi:vesicle coat complex subunit